jgi:hypothetical protein
LITRLVLLTLKPEAWAETARYPLHVTLLPLLLAILLGAVAVTSAQTYRLIGALQSFAATYDQKYPALEFDSSGVLSAKGELPDPIRFNLPDMLTQSEMPVLIDPTGKTTPESIKSSGFFITDKNAVVTSPDGPAFTLPLTTAVMFIEMRVPGPGTSKLINGAALQEAVTNRIPGVILSGVMTIFLLSLGEAAWAAFMIFLLSPMVILAAAGPRPESGPDKRLILPRRAAARIVAGLLVPLVLANAALRASGHPLQGSLHQFAFFFWILAAAAMAIWAGVLAKKMFAPAGNRNKNKK